MFVVVEGGEGVGKTTLLENLKPHFPDAIFTRSPGGTELGKEIRQQILFPKPGMEPSKMVNLLLFAADMRQTMDELIDPARKDGRTIFVDRWWYSTYCYQMADGTLPNTPNAREWLVDLFGVTLPVQPDLILWLSTPPEIALERCEGRDVFEAKGLEFHKQVQYGYRLLMKFLHLTTKVVRIENESPEETLAQALKALGR